MNNGAMKSWLPRAWCLAVVLASIDPALAEKGFTRFERRAIEQAVEKTENRFEVPAAEADQAWGRATEWLTVVAGMRMDVVTETFLQTERNPKRTFDAEPYCTANRVDFGEFQRFTLLCGSDLALSGSAGRYTAVLSRYARTGDSTCFGRGKGIGTSQITARCLIQCDQTKRNCWTKQDKP